MSDEDVAIQFRTLLERYVAAFVAGNMKQVKALWDPDAIDRTYISAELERPILGAPALEAYYDELASAFVVTEGKVGDVVVREVGGLAYVVTHIDWGFEMGAQKFAVRIRASILSRRRGGGWRFLHAHESIQWKIPT
ncbi:MAG TPA: nuclear transport factor 2 family protein [Sorangium sp.]|uniref:YybH family protein n=1 Tax=Sorangium sp. So ce388 TaxID=3133309 RepID=UPI002CDA29D8|nr:nuclear transport factor 2 family protein [Sorangium sp.]